MVFVALREILEYPDPRLREVAKPVAEVTPEIQALVDDMAETMYAAPGCGLAATQLGIPQRIFVVDCAEEDEPSDLKVFINPEILEKDGQVVWAEGCLSFPGVREDIKRAEKVTVLASEGHIGDGPGAEAAALHLRRNGVKATALTVKTGDRTTGEVILDHAASLGCDLLVKSAYTQSRLRQMIFGGATRHILAHASLPVLMAH